MKNLFHFRPWEWSCSFGTVAKAVELLELAGFDPAAYRDAHPDLTQALRGPGDALFHFLFYGCQEQRKFPIKLNIAPLLGFRDLAFVEPTYYATVIAALASAFLYDRHGSVDQWIDRRWPDIVALQDIGARPYIVAGSSAIDIYSRFNPRAEDWSLPLPLRFGGCSAISLGKPNSRQGQRFVDFMGALDGFRGAETLPILCLFGGTDVDYSYHIKRIRDGRWEFDRIHFDEYCISSVKAYIGFLNGLFSPRRRVFVSVLSITPPAVLTENWVDHVTSLVVSRNHADEDAAEFKRRACRLEMPSHRERTRLHARYNELLRTETIEHGFAFVDHFMSFLGADELLDPDLVPNTRGTDDHLEHDATGHVTNPVIWRGIDFDPLACNEAIASADNEELSTLIRKFAI